MKPLYYLLFLSLSLSALSQEPPSSARSTKAIDGQIPILREALAAKGMTLGDPVFMRIFKESNELEVWMKPEDSDEFELFKIYEICYYSGDLGPKTKQGDRQSPEGFYFVNAGRFNPWSSFHLSLNMGYPNTYDRAKGYTGNYLMIHGSCVSIGCYAMKDEGIEEIYTLAHKAVEQGQTFFRVHSFPFRMTDAAMAKTADHKWNSFWKNLKAGYDWFEEKKLPPNVNVRNGEYVFN
ncbi:MAG: murein L,D-transpeptidase [Roseivirga sp.]|nr:murein L,D-transpeptidase [Roseivirga sp.]